MQATNLLRAEHASIADMLKILSIFAVKARAGLKFDKTQARKIVEYLLFFVDKTHQAKEEQILFPELIKAGMARSGGLLGMMLHEHEWSRGYIDDMGLALEADDHESFATAAENAIELMTSHYDREDKVLFSIADEVLPAEKQEEISRQFRSAEPGRAGPGIHEFFHRFLNDLQYQYLGNA